ncbi:MAG: dUTP diphosphatase [Rhodospirillales bacterium]|jgi:dUTP pyrophosphatase|nr:dUTP diphosphatase [Rhodospirillales bacterium]
MTALGVAILRLPHGADLALPEYASPHSAGLDLMAAVASPVALEAGARVVIPTGIAVALPLGFEAQIRPRSGLAAKHGITVLNSPGTVDSDYRGEIKVILANLGPAAFTIERGMRIAQMVVAPVSTVVWRAVRRLPASARGDGGLGSTGTMPPA